GDVDVWRINTGKSTIESGSISAKIDGILVGWPFVYSKKFTINYGKVNCVQPSAPTNVRFAQSHDNKRLDYACGKGYLRENSATSRETISPLWNAPANAADCSKIHYVVTGYYNGVHAPSLDQDAKPDAVSNSTVGSLGDGVYEFKLVASDATSGLERD